MTVDNRHPSHPLCVDLDGTLIRSDVLWESLIQLVKGNPFLLFMLPLWMLGGKARFKAMVARRTAPDVAHLPYCEVFLDYLREQSDAGRTLILATAANERPAQAIADHLGIFRRVFASDATTNLSGRHKRELLVRELGAKGFDYAGNAMVDLTVWSQADGAILVNPLPGVRSAAEGRFRILRVFQDRPRGLRPFIGAMRVHQWLKNTLVLVPLGASHQFQDLVLVGQALLAFGAFCLCASSVYLLNDLFDLPQDRRHPTKRRRALASGDIGIQSAVASMLGLLAAAFVIAALLPPDFSALLAAYWVSTLAYSLRLKQAALVDVLTLAGLYTLRVLAGSAAVSLETSFWLLAFSMFLFVSLALVKRYSELSILGACGTGERTGRGYRPEDTETLSQLGTASGFVAVLVLALYISSEQVNALYSHPKAIWLLCPLVLYWISRVWLLARRGELHEDPVVFALTDRRSHVTVVLAIAVLLVAL